MLLLIYLFFLEDMRKTWSSKLACAAVLLGFAILQLAHFLQFFSGSDLLAMRSYCLLLAALPTAFFFFSREVLFTETKYKVLDALHLLPLIYGFVLPVSVLPTFSFVVGTFYTVWLASRVYSLRNQRSRFKVEMFFFSLFALMAALALLLGLALPLLDHAIFYHTYANAISLAIFLVVAALLIFPDMLSDLVVITELAYTQSKLQRVDVESKLADLDQLMNTERHFENEALNLATLAELMNLSAHQLSELINSHYGVGFPRFLRQHRVEAAKALLLEEPDASILSVSLMIGFRSQSSFYSAFKELTGLSPGAYRQQHSS